MWPSASPATKFRCGAPALAARVERLPGRPRLDQPDEAQVEGLPVVRHPAQGPGSASMIGVDDRPPDGGAHLERDVGAALDSDRLAAKAETPRALGREVGVRVGRVDVEHDEVRPVGLGVGQAPGHPAIAAGDQCRDAGQRHADGAPGVARLAFIGPDQAGAIPGGGHAVLQVHVVGHQGRAVPGVRAGDRPVVAAGALAFDLVQGRVVDGGDVGPAPEVDHLGAGDGRHGDRPAHDRRIPLGGARGREELGQGTGQDVEGHPQARLLGPGLFLEAHEHLEHDEHRVLGGPGLGPSAEEQVLERLRTERPEPRVDAQGVGLEPGAVGGRQRRDDLSGPLAELVPAHRAVEIDDLVAPAGAEDLGQLARRGPPLDLHLEESLLRVQEAQAEDQVAPGGRPDRRNAKRVTVDPDRGRRPAHDDPAGERRQAGP